MTEIANLFDNAGGWEFEEYYSTIQAADIDGDGCAELLARGADAIKVAKWDRATQMWILMPDGPALSDADNWNQRQYYSTIQCADIDGDGQDELLARSSSGISVWKYNNDTSRWVSLPDGPRLSDDDGWFNVQYYSTIQCADIDGDGQAELLGRSGAGIRAWKYDKVTHQWLNLPDGPPLSDANKWNLPQYYSTIQCADIDGDGQDELLARYSDRIRLWKYVPSQNSWFSIILGPELSDAAGWGKPEYYSTIQCADVNGDGQAEIMGRYIDGIRAWYYDKDRGQWYALPAGPNWSDSGGWKYPSYYSTIQCADLNGDGRAELLGRGAGGILIFRYDETTRQWIPFDGPNWSDADGWNRPEYYSTIMAAELDGYGQDELTGRAVLGMKVWQNDSVYVETWRSVLQQAIADPSFGKQLKQNPIAVLNSAGIDVPPQSQPLAIQTVELILSPPSSPDVAPSRKQLRSTSEATDSEYVSATEDWYGLTVYLSPKAVSDVGQGLSLKPSIEKAIAAAGGKAALSSAAALMGPELAIIVPYLVTYLVMLANLIVMVDQGKGVNLIIPWTSFIPPPYPNTMGLVIPIAV